MSLMQCVGLEKIYPNGKHAVKGVDFHIEPGEIVGLLGPNGAGKSTSFGMGIGFVEPTKGKVLFNGHDVTYWPVWQRARNGLGYLPQKDCTFGKLSAENNIIAILEYLKMSYRERMERTNLLLDQFGLTAKRKQIASTLSGGERRRLEIARCLASSPQLILLDEPFTGIDPVTIHSIQDIIAELRDQGIAILLTDHRERETLILTDRTYIILDGQVLVSGDVQTVLGHPEARRKYFGDRFDAPSIIAGKQEFNAHRSRVLPKPPADGQAAA